MPLAGRRRDREARPERERDWSGTRLTRVTDSDVTDCCVLVKVPCSVRLAALDFALGLWR